MGDVIWDVLYLGLMALGAYNIRTMLQGFFDRTAGMLESQNRINAKDHTKHLLIMETLVEFSMKDAAKCGDMGKRCQAESLQVRIMHLLQQEKGKVYGGMASQHAPVDRRESRRDEETPNPAP